MILIPAILFSALSAQAPSTDLVDFQLVRVGEFKKVQQIRERIISQNKNATGAELVADPEIVQLGLDPHSRESDTIIQEALSYHFDQGVLTDYHPLDLASSDPVLGYTTLKFDNDQGKPHCVTVKSELAGQKLAVYKVKVTETPTGTTSQPATPTSYEQYTGPWVKDDLDHWLKSLQAATGVKRTTEIEAGEEIGAKLYDNGKGDVVVVLDKVPDQPLAFLPDGPQMLLAKNTPENLQRGLDQQNPNARAEFFSPSLAVLQDGKPVDFQDVRQKGYLELQKLRDTTMAVHPTSAQFPPEMLATPEFKSMGLDASRDEDQRILASALSFEPEDAVMHGYHPIDWDKDKAAGYAAVVLGTNGPTAVTLKDAFQGKSPCVMRLKYTPVARAGSQDQPQTIYAGPITSDTLLGLSKAAFGKGTFEEIKSEDLPLQIYTNDKGDLAFVFTTRPPKPLLVPPSPPVPFYNDPVDKVKGFLNSPANKVQQSLHPVVAAFAVKKA